MKRNDEKSRIDEENMVVHVMWQKIWEKIGKYCLCEGREKERENMMCEKI